ncbi:c-Myc-binding protein-like isoform X2 [Ylistrum balloti]|uniref:c-Myc-binding protein-like isoform X2 n=1 Tax=Pecten maximus TaxID=6579 RepID=UPI001457EC90|nr:c-Myc-binding protein-like isoform X2 [Pecten maximus]XP_060082474.1 c-Myc-binding protein-like isoform X2 [Ylistrum balloti]
MPSEAADSKREEFRKYLEKAGVLDALTKVLVGLYEEPEKPNNALDFLKQHLGASGPETADVEALKQEVTELRQKVEQLSEENTDLKAKVGNLQQYEPPTDEQAPDS